MNDAFWVSRCAAGGNHDGIAFFDCQSAVQGPGFPIGLDNGAGPKGGQHPVLFRFWQPIVQGGNGIASGPDATDRCLIAWPAGKSECDESAHVN